MRKFIFFVLLVTSVFLLYACSGIKKQQPFLTSASENKLSVQGQNTEKTSTALDFKLMNTKGTTYTLSDYRGKQPVLLFFWTTWCPFCQAEIKKISGRTQELSGVGVEVLAINLGEPKERVMRFIIDHKINLTVLFDNDSSVSNSYEILGVPTFCLIDKQGKIIFEDNTFPENYKKLILSK